MRYSVRVNRLILIITFVSIGGAVNVARNPPDVPAQAEAKPVRYSKPNPWSKDEILAEQPQERSRPYASRPDTPAMGSGGEVRLEREGDGHFYADILVRGVSVNAVVDTGASVIALPGDEARRIGFTWSASDVRPVARGASGTVYGVVRRAEVVTLGSLTARDLEVMIIPEGLDVTLLGQNFLKQVKKVEMRGDEMVLSNL